MLGDIDLRIHSWVAMPDGLAIYNTLSCLSANINIYIDGIAASMASVIALFAKRHSSTCRKTPG